ncbi:hypothetical protein HOC80_02670 [archaeon]|jgi:hypothetical protein|nr:hypothetical protein [archaeon]MBT4416984.1 hypothetical protein [archaeon]
MARVIIPKTWVPIDGPFVYLAGPIRGAPNWQDEAVKYLVSQKQDITIISPRREIREAIERYVVKGEEGAFDRQRKWERQYMDMAMIGGQGVIMFWLPGETNHLCQKPYGAMTRFELGYVLANHRNDRSAKFCIGSDGNFPELRTIEVDLSIDSPLTTVYETLEATCYKALNLMK